MRPRGLSRRNFVITCAARAGAAVLAPRPFGSRAEASLPLGVPDDFIQLNSNENPYGLSRTALEAFARCAGVAARYPDGAEEEAHNAIAKHHRRQARTGRPRMRLERHPAHGGRGLPGLGKDRGRRRADLRGRASLRGRHEGAVGEGSLDPRTSATTCPKMAAACDARTGLVYICNPNNPTGTIVSRDELAAFLSKAPAFLRRPRRRSVLSFRKRPAVRQRARPARRAIRTSSSPARSRRSTRWRACAWATRSLPKPTPTRFPARPPGTTPAPRALGGPGVSRRRRSRCRRSGARSTARGSGSAASSTGRSGATSLRRPISS